MTPEGVDEGRDESDRVARGFEALVDEEALFPGTPPAAKPASADPKVGAADNGPASVPSFSATADSPPLPGDSKRLDQLEERVRQTMDRLTELVEAQLPEAVDGLRADLETLRLELQTTLEQATGQLADERKELRSQIATTVGAANRWFVRTRDQLYERLDHIAEVAADAQAQAEVAATAAATAATTAAASPPPPPALAPPTPPALLPAAVERREVDDVELEWDVEDELTPVPAVRADVPQLGGLMKPVRADLQELQAEVAGLRATVDRLERRLARPKPVKLDPSQIELIVEAMALVLPEPPPARRATPARSRVVKAAPATRKAAASARAGKAASSRKAAAAPAKATARRTKKAARKVPPTSSTPFRSFI